MFSHIALFLNVNDLFTRLRACCTGFKKIIKDHQLILIQHKKALVCFDEKDIQIYQKCIQIPRFNKNDTKEMCTGSSFVKQLEFN